MQSARKDRLSVFSWLLGSSRAIYSFHSAQSGPRSKITDRKVNIKRISHMHCRHTHTETHTQLLLIALTTVRSPASCLATGKSQGPKPKHLTFASLFWAFRQQQYSWQEDTMMFFFCFFGGGGRSEQLLLYAKILQMERKTGRWN